MSGLQGKVAIVTGAGRNKGLGEAMAKRLAADGAKVVVHDIGVVKGDIAPSHGVGQKLNSTKSSMKLFLAEVRLQALPETC